MSSLSYSTLGIPAFINKFCIHRPTSSEIHNLQQNKLNTRIIYFDENTFCWRFFRTKQF